MQGHVLRWLPVDCAVNQSEVMLTVLFANNKFNRKFRQQRQSGIKWTGVCAVKRNQHSF